jgi:hypothetical protein
LLIITDFAKPMLQSNFLIRRSLKKTWANSLERAELWYICVIDLEAGEHFLQVDIFKK